MLGNKFAVVILVQRQLGFSGQKTKCFLHHQPQCLLIDMNTEKIIDCKEKMSFYRNQIKQSIKTKYLKVLGRWFNQAINGRQLEYFENLEYSTTYVNV
jgi:hypothetical protein